VKFYDHVIKIIEEELKNRDTIQKIFDDIKMASSKGRIAFYPCNKFLRDLLAEIKQIEPSILHHVFGCFDKATEVNSDRDIEVFNIKDLDKYADQISLLVITSNNFPSREFKDIKEITNYAGKIRETSNFDISLSQKYSPQEALDKIIETYKLLEDDKSKMTYLLVWLYSLLKDERLSNVFDREERVKVTEDEINWRSYNIKGLGKNLSNIEELHYEIYKMKYVYPEKGDFIFDIGAYVGDTAAFFAHYIGENGKIYSFEPIKANYDKLKENIVENSLENIVIPINSGCGKKTELMGAISVTDGAPWSFLTEENGSESVNVMAIDDFITSNNIEKVDYIKMDVEGYERDVILGAKQSIKKYRPKMAICLYHKTEDLFDLPLLVKEISDYIFYVRCAKGGPFGTILFCLPR
jgi:FkbM family methyltransferase